MIEVKSHKIIIHYINGVLVPPRSVEIVPSITKMENALESYKKCENERLILRGIKMREIPEMLSFGILWERIKLLDLSEMGLKSLKNLPDFKACKKLDCTMNNLNDEEVENICMKFKAVETVYLTENWISKKNSILMFRQLKNVQELDFTNNPVKYEIQDIFWEFRNKEKFIVLDRTDKDGKEIDGFYFNDGSDESDEEEDEDEDEDGDEEREENNSGNSLSEEEHESSANHSSEECEENEEDYQHKKKYGD